MSLFLGRAQQSWRAGRPSRHAALSTRHPAPYSRVSCLGGPVQRWGSPAAPAPPGDAVLRRRRRQHASQQQGAEPLLEQPSGAQGLAPRLLAAGMKALGTAAVLLMAAGVHATPAHAAGSRQPPTAAAATAAAGASEHTGQRGAPRWGAGWRATGVDLADGGEPRSAARPEAGAPGGALPAQGRRYTRRDMEDAIRSDPEVRAAISAKRAQFFARHPSAAAAGVLQRDMHERLGVPLDFDDLLRSMVYAPGDVPVRKDRAGVAEQITAILSQYDNEDFDLGIKQFMIEQAIQQEMEEGLDRGGDNKDFEEKLAEQLYGGDDDPSVKRTKLWHTEDVGVDAFTTDVAEEHLTLHGAPGSVRTAWRTQEHLQALSYTQFWYLVGEGNVRSVRFYGPERNALMATLQASAPGGARTCKVVVPPDPELMEHLVAHGVAVTEGQGEAARLGRALFAQLVRYTFPFVFISFLFWTLHTWILDPVPNKFRKREFIRYRREILAVGSKLNFRSPARQVFIDTSSPSFIGWDDISGIDVVKAEIEEIIDYLKNPALLRLRGVSRIGGVLLAGAPGTGKTLLAKAIAAESGVKMFTCSGTDFYDVYTGVGARRIRETFDMLRNHAPAILFVDEFDAMGAARGGAAAGDESTSIINELLVQMDGFEDNRGIVVLGATNRPGAIDAALIRPGRFDRVIYMPLPDAEGRAKILQVHARNKAVDPNINWYEAARAMAGFTGADCMGLMQRAARMAARQGRDRIVEDDIYAAMENKAMESYVEMTGGLAEGDGGTPDPIPHSLRKSIAVYEAGKALLAYITPEYDEVARVSVCPYNIVTGYTLFVEDEERTAGSVLTRADMEARMVVSLAGRCAEKLVMGEGEVTGLGVPDMFHANMIAREMVLSGGMGGRMGPMDLMHIKSPAGDTGSLLRALDPTEADQEEYFYHATDMSTEQSRVAMAEVIELMEAAEAKAMYGLAINWVPLQKMTEALLERGVLRGREVAHTLETAGVIHFPDPYLLGFGWDERGNLQYPLKPADAAGDGDAADAAASEREPALAGVAAKTWYAGTDRDAPRNADGKFKYGWHWNSPYIIQRDLPDWYRKEVERYTGS